MNGGHSWSSRSAAYASSTTHRESTTLTTLLRLLRPGRNDRCLDIGTGAGHTAARLAAVAGRVVGLDPAPGMLEMARSLYGDLGNLTFMRGSGADSGLPGGSFDLVAARHTLHHHPDPVATLREVARLLRPGGRFGFVDEIAPAARVDTWYHDLEVARDPSHVRAYTLAMWQSMVRKADLTWVVGDGTSCEHIEVNDWLARLALSPEQEEIVRAMLRNAGKDAGTLFGIRYDTAGEATHFDMPVATVLAVKEEA